MDSPSTRSAQASRVIRTYTRTVGWEWIHEALARLEGVEPHEVSQVLNASRRWPRPAIGLGGVRVLVIWGRTWPVVRCWSW
jgi:hypothetical protein